MPATKPSLERGYVPPGVAYAEQLRVGGQRSGRRPSAGPGGRRRCRCRARRSRRRDRSHDGGCGCRAPRSSACHHPSGSSDHRDPSRRTRRARCRGTAGRDRRGPARCARPGSSVRQVRGDRLPGATAVATHHQVGAVVAFLVVVETEVDRVRVVQVGTDVVHERALRRTPGSEPTSIERHALAAVLTDLDQAVVGAGVEQALLQRRLTRAR